VTLKEGTMSIPFNIENEQIIEPQKVIKIAQRKQVVVVGGGTAGAVAAIAAARNGADTLMVERFGCLGGTWTGGLMIHADIRHAYYDRIPHEEVVVRGLYEEIIERCRELDGVIEEYLFKERLLSYIGGIECFDPEILTYVLASMARESNVDLLLHTIATEAILDKNELRGIVIENKSGRQAILGEVFIDCTGDADIAAMAGVPFEKGRREDGKMQPVSLGFRIGNVDMDKFMNKYGREKKQIQIGIEPEVAFRHPFRAEVDAARKKGEYPTPKGITIHMTSVKNVLYVNATRVHDVDATDGKNVSDAELVARDQVMGLVRFFSKYIEGCENVFLIDTGNQIGIRESRRIIGEYVVTSEDILSGRRFEDAIAKSAQRMDEHSPNGGTTTFKPLTPGRTYQIPYRCLVPKSVERLLVAGRCVSATRAAQASLRTVPNCVSMGQATGTAAALSVEREIMPRYLDVSSLQEKLISQGVLI